MMAGAAHDLLLLVGVKDMAVAVRLQALLAPFAADPRLLMASEERLRRRLLPRVDEDGTSLQTLADALRPLDVLAPDAGTKTGVGVVRTRNDLIFIGPRLSGDDRAEGLFGDDAGVVWRVVDDGWLDKETLALGDLWLADGELVTLRLAVLEEGLNLLVLPVAWLASAIGH